MDFLLFVLHIGATTRISIIKTTAAMIIPANVAFGMYEKYGVKNMRDKRTMADVKMLPIGVRTPLALFTALRLRDPVPGKPWAKEFTMLAVPIAINSCDASTGLPLAIKKNNQKLMQKKIFH